MDWTQDYYTLCDDPLRVDVARTHALLERTYWGVRRPSDVVARMIEKSMPFTLLCHGSQVGFARAVTDYTVFTWVADLVIDEAHRGRGLGQWMMTFILQHPALKRTQFVLQTRDAHALYERYGFGRNEALMSTRVEGL
jgi:GNAT superfamily N-acetyltransferase